MVNALNNPLRQSKRTKSPASMAARQLIASYRVHAGYYLRSARERMGMTQQQVADLIGVSFSRVSHYEVGQDQLSPEHYKKVAKILELDEKEMALKMLRWTNPWIYDMLYGGDTQLRRELKILSSPADAVSAAE